MLEPAWWTLGFALPLFAAAAAFVVWAQPWRDASPASTAMAWAMAVADGFGLGYLALLLTKRTLPLPPVESAHWLALVVLPAVAAAEVVAALPRVRPRMAWALRAPVLAAIPWLILRRYPGWSGAEGHAYRAMLAGGIVAGRVLLHLAARREASTAPWLAMGATVAGAGVAVMSTGSVTLGQTVLTLAAALGGAWLAALFLRAPSLLTGGLGVAWAIYAGLLVNARFYSSMTTLQASVLAAAPLLTAFVPALPWVRARRPWVRAVATLIVAAAVAGAVAAPAALKAQKAAEGEDLYY